MVTKPTSVPQAGCLVCMEKLRKIFYTFVKNLNEEDQSHGKIILKLLWNEWDAEFIFPNITLFCEYVTNISMKEEESIDSWATLRLWRQCLLDFLRFVSYM